MFCLSIEIGKKKKVTGNGAKREGATAVAIAQRYYEVFEQEDERRYGDCGQCGSGAVDLKKLCAIFGKMERTMAQNRRIHFKTIDAGLEPDNSIRTAARDGEWYVELAALFNFFNWDRKQITVQGRGCSRVVIQNGQCYQKGIDGYQEGYTYVKVSALGLTATLDGDTLEIE
jgi:hypothetical protein